MNGTSIFVDPLPESCPDCKAVYRHIGHPLRPGVIMQTLCDCEYVTVSDGASGGTVVVRMAPPVAALWRKGQGTLSTGSLSMGTRVPYVPCPDCPSGGCPHVLRG